MLNRIRTPRVAVLVALVVAMMFSVTDAATPAAGKITYMKGTVQAFAGGAWAKLKKGDSIYGGQMIRTLKKSRVEIVLADESVIRLGSRSKVKIKEALFKKDATQFSAKMFRGKAYAMASKLVGGDSKFEVTTSNAVAGVRGTTFRIDAKRDKSTVVRVYTGAVAVSNAPREGVKPGGAGRVEVAGPSEVTKKEWEEFVAKAMQEVRVAANGELSEPVAFDSEADAADEWVAWNQSRDKQSSE